jgi:feruloyl esterase
VRSMYTGLKTTDGRVASYPLSRGGEGGWSRFIPVDPVSDAKAGMGNAGNGLAGLRKALFGDPNYDLRTFDEERDLTKMRGSEFAGSYEAANPDITRSSGVAASYCSGMDSTIQVRAPWALLNTMRACGRRRGLRRRR